MKILSHIINEALVSATKLSKDDTTLFLSELLDPIPNLEYKITNKGGKYLITFTSEKVGFDRDYGIENNPTIDGKLYNCNLFFDTVETISTTKCYLNLSNLTIKNSIGFNVSYNNNLENVKIVSPTHVYFIRNSAIKNVQVKTDLDVLFNFWGAQKYWVRDLKVEGREINLTSWKPSMCSGVTFACKSLIVKDSYQPWTSLVQKMKSVKTKEQIETKKGTIQADLLLKMIEGCLDVKFKKLPTEIKFIDGNKRYVFTTQVDNNYEWKYTK